MLLDLFDLSNVAILLDVDGTILDIAPTMYDVNVPNSLRRTLLRVSECADGALALVSGRPLKDIDLLFAPLRLPAIGGHGAEIRPTANGYIDARRATSLDHGLKQRLKEIATRHPGVAVEDKGYSLGLTTARDRGSLRHPTSFAFAMSMSRPLLSSSPEKPSSRSRLPAITKGRRFAS